MKRQKQEDKTKTTDESGDDTSKNMEEGEKGERERKKARGTSEPIFGSALGQPRGPLMEDGSPGGPGLHYKPPK